MEISYKWLKAVSYTHLYELDVGKDKVELTRISVDDLKGWDSNNEEDLK